MAITRNLFRQIDQIRPGQHADAGSTDLLIGRSFDLSARGPLSRDGTFHYGIIVLVQVRAPPTMQMRIASHCHACRVVFHAHRVSERQSVVERYSERSGLRYDAPHLTAASKMPQARCISVENKDEYSHAPRGDRYDNTTWSM